jgi:DNA-binding transcriptional regulator PaaX
MKKEIIKKEALVLGNILLTGLAVTGMLGVAIMAPNAAQILKFVIPEKDIKRHYKYRIHNSLEKLIKDGYVIEKISKGRKILSLTNKGKLRYESLKKKKPQKWDGKWRLVSFDVYEKNRNKRNLLRRELQEYGFVMIHQSMWVYPYPCDEYIALLKSDLYFGKNVQYILAERLETNFELKKRFNL